MDHDAPWRTMTATRRRAWRARQRRESATGVAKQRRRMAAAELEVERGRTTRHVAGLARAARAPSETQHCQQRATREPHSRRTQRLKALHARASSAARAADASRLKHRDLVCVRVEQREHRAYSIIVLAVSRTWIQKLIH